MVKNFEEQEVIIQDRKSKYDEPWIQEYIVTERNSSKTFDEIAQGLKQRGIDGATAGTVSIAWKRALARTQVTSTAAKDDFIDFTEEIRAIYGDAIQLIGEYVRTLRKINDELKQIEVVDENGKVNVLTTQMAIAKQIPLATSLMREVREYVKNQISLYDTIQQTAQKDIIYSPQQIIDQINDYLPILLKEKEKAGQIKILDKSIIN